MNFRGCSHEKELAQALKDGHWPQGCARELRAHVDSCASCSDLVLVTETFQRARSESARATPSDSPSLLWWRAQLRRRNTVNERVSRPFTIAQSFALFLNLVVAVVFVAWQYHHGLRWAEWWSGLSPARVFHGLSHAVLDWNLLLLIPCLAALALLSGIVLFLVAEKS